MVSRRHLPARSGENESHGLDDTVSAPSRSPADPSDHASVTLLTGFVFYIAVVHIPERFQIVSGDNAVIAGVKFLPMMAGSAVGSFVAGAVNQRRNLTSPIIVIATALQVLGYGLMSSLGDDIGTPKAIYGYQVLVGLGFGLSIASATIMVQINLTSRPQFMGEFHRTNST